MQLDFRLLLTDKIDYVTYDSMFTEDYLKALLWECMFIEAHYMHKFTKSKVKRNHEEVEEGDYKNYHRISNVFWFTYLQEEHLEYVPNILKFKQWAQSLKEAINKQMPQGFEVAEIEEQYLFYEEGGKFETHLDTNCHPFVDCIIGTVDQYPRIMTYLIYLNPEWQESDGGTLSIFKSWPFGDLQETIEPHLGKAMFFRSDKLFH